MELHAFQFRGFRSRLSHDQNQYENVRLFLHHCVIVNIASITDMSYNGIGLQSARGSGTSGYVQTNLALSPGSAQGTYKKRRLISKRRANKVRSKVNEAQKHKARLDIATHSKRREIEVECMELREKLEEAGDDLIEQRVTDLRLKLTKAMEENFTQHCSEDLDTKEHRKEDKIMTRPQSLDEDCKEASVLAGVALIEDKPHNAFNYVPRYKNRQLDDTNGPRS